MSEGHRPTILRVACWAVAIAALGWCLRTVAWGSRTDAGVRLELWTLALKPTFNQYMAERLAAFEAANPGVRVEWIDLPFEALDRKLIAAASAGRAPDVVNLSDLQFGRFVGLGALEDLRPALGDEPERVYLPGALRLGKVGGKLMALPWYLTTQVSMINAGMLGEGGLEPAGVARRWEDVREQAKAYHAKTGKFLFSQPMGAESQIPVMMLASGISPLRIEADGRVRADLLKPEAVEYAKGWVEFYRSGAMPRAAATRNHSHLTEMYKNAELAMIDTGPNFLSRVKGDAPKVYEGTTVRAGVTGGLGRQHLAVMTLCVTRQSRHPREAAALAAFLTNTESQVGLCRLVPVLPSTIEGAKSPVVTGRETVPGTDPAVVQARAIAAAALPDAVAFTPALVSWPDLRRTFEDGIKGALLDGRDVRIVLGEINEQWDRVLTAAGETAAPDAIPMPGPVGSAGVGNGRDAR